MGEDRAPVLVTDVWSLPVDLGRIMHGPEHFEELIERNALRVERHLRGLGMAGGVRADLLICRILRDTARVADLHLHHTRNPAEHILHSPEATRREGRLLLSHLSSSKFCV